MTLGVVFKSSEGIVLAADSRVTVAGSNADGSSIVLGHYDNATKLFSVGPNNNVGVVTSGLGAIGSPEGPRTVHSYLSEFEKELAETVVVSSNLTVEKIASTLSRFFENRWQEAGLPSKEEATEFVVAGFDSDNIYGKVFNFSIPEFPQPIEQSGGVGEFGIGWGGQGEVADRLIYGFDSQIPAILQNATGFSDEARRNLEEFLRSHLQIGIPGPLLPLQDAVDLCILLIRTTMAFQNLSMGNRGVGGPIDVAVITRDGGLEFLQRKVLVAESVEAYGVPSRRGGAR